MNLTRRESEVMRLVADGFTNRQIGSLLSVGEETVKQHVKNARRKLGARNRAHAVAIVLQREEAENAVA